MEKIDAILVLIERIYFPKLGPQERSLTNKHNGKKCRASYFGYNNFGVKKKMQTNMHTLAVFFFQISYILMQRQIGT